MESERKKAMTASGEIISNIIGSISSAVDGEEMHHHQCNKNLLPYYMSHVCQWWQWPLKKKKKNMFKHDQTIRQSCQVETQSVFAENLSRVYFLD